MPTRRMPMPPLLKPDAAPPATRCLIAAMLPERVAACPITPRADARPLLLLTRYDAYGLPIDAALLSRHAIIFASRFISFRHTLKPLIRQFSDCHYRIFDILFISPFSISSSFLRLADIIILRLLCCFASLFIDSFAFRYIDG
jgi:hypothetical protein